MPYLFEKRDLIIGRCRDINDDERRGVNILCQGSQQVIWVLHEVDKEVASEEDDFQVLADLGFALDHDNTAGPGELALGTFVRCNNVRASHMQGVDRSGKEPKAGNNESKPILLALL